jgi:hypothetical protein
MTELFRTLRATVLELEDAWTAGRLGARLADPGLPERIGPDLLACYVELSARSTAVDPDLRRATVLALLRQLSDEVFSVERWGVVHGSVAGTAGTLPTVLGDGPPVEQRLDQIGARRFWGLGFVHEDDVDATDQLARRCVRRGIKRFARDLRDLAGMLRRPPENGAIHIPSHHDRRFEQLMLDILVEDQPRAQTARLVEDFCQKTDLRVHYAGLARQRGARVQIKSTACPVLHAERLASIRRRDTLVILSPVTLAEFIDEQQRAGIPARVLSPAAMREFWRALPGEPAAIDELAFAIRAELFRALEVRCEDPRGPMALVAPALRLVIRVFVEDRAFRSTGAVRRFEASHEVRRRAPARAAGGGDGLRTG